jgi:hypothetical protein
VEFSSGQEKAFYVPQFENLSLYIFLLLFNYNVLFLRYLVFICFSIRKIGPNNKRRKQHDFFPSKAMRGFVCKHARGYGYHITMKLAAQDSLYY